MNQGTSTQKADSPIDNLCFDIAAILQKKVKALEAYEKYTQDAQGYQEVLQVLQQIHQQEVEQINDLKGCLSQLLANPPTKGNTEASSAKV